MELSAIDRIAFDQLTTDRQNEVGSLRQNYDVTDQELSQLKRDDKLERKNERRQKRELCRSIRQRRKNRKREIKYVQKHRNNEKASALKIIRQDTSTT